MIKKILKIIGIVIVSIAIVAVLFIEFWPSLGGSVTDEDQKEYDRFKVLTRTKMSSEIQELLAKNERKDIDKAKIYIYYIKWICFMGGDVQFDKTTNDELGNTQENLESLKKK